MTQPQVERGASADPRSADSIINVIGLNKAFGPTHALRSLSLQFRPGEIHALCGQNGSGKSTLVKILTGSYIADSGTVTVWGDEIQHGWKPGDHGIAAIFQDLGLVEDMTALENFGVTSGYSGGRVKRPVKVSWSAERKCLQEYLGKVGATFAAKTPVRNLLPSERALLAIARALRNLDQVASQAAFRLLILDEPTVYLPGPDKAVLAEVMRSLARQNVGVLLVSHELDYVLQVAGKVSVLRDGELVSSQLSTSLSKSAIVELMIGRSVTKFYPDRPAVPEAGQPLMRITHLSGKTIDDLQLDLAPGEIVGITGLAGAGQDELPYLIHSQVRRRSRSVQLRPDVEETRQPASMPIAVVPANRASAGVWMEGTAAENTTLACLSRHVKGGRLDRRADETAALEAMRQFGVRPLLPKASLRSFSGGNQQKMVLARWFMTDVRVYVLHEPVQGIDVAANAEIFQLIMNAALEGRGIIICSNEWEQLAHLSHRVLVLREGVVTDHLSGHRLTEANLALACQGAVPELATSEEGPAE